MKISRYKDPDFRGTQFEFPSGVKINVQHKNRSWDDWKVHYRDEERKVSAYAKGINLNTVFLELRVKVRSILNPDIAKVMERMDEKNIEDKFDGVRHSVQMGRRAGKSTQIQQLARYQGLYNAGFLTAGELSDRIKDTLAMKSLVEFTGGGTITIPKVAPHLDEEE